MPLVEAGFYDKDGYPDKVLIEGYGPTINVIVSHYSPDGSTVSPETKMVKALIDTGATESCIDQALAIELGLPATDIRTVGGVGGSAQHDVYTAQITIPGLDTHPYGQFTGVHLVAGGQVHEVLLGRTFLRNTIMIYDGLRGTVTIAAQSLPK